jgi:hypothetical protein
MKALCCALAVMAAPVAWARADEAKDLVGTWTWSWKDGQGEKHTHVLEVESAGGKLAARERFDDQEPVKVTDLKVSGKKVTFSVMRGEARASYNGSLDSADTINGKVMIARAGQTDEFGWTAKKETKPK